MAVRERNRLSRALSSLLEGPRMVVQEALSCAGVIDDPGTLLGNRLTTISHRN
jgi:hypothetical protein